MSAQEKNSAANVSMWSSITYQGSNISCQPFAIIPTLPQAEHLHLLPAVIQRSHVSALFALQTYIVYLKHIEDSKQMIWSLIRITKIHRALLFFPLASEDINSVEVACVCLLRNLPCEVINYNALFWPLSFLAALTLIEYFFRLHTKVFRMWKAFQDTSTTTLYWIPVLNPEEPPCNPNSWMILGRRAIGNMSPEQNVSSRHVCMHDYDESSEKMLGDDWLRNRKTEIATYAVW